MSVEMKCHGNRRGSWTLRGMKEWAVSGNDRVKRVGSSPMLVAVGAEYTSSPFVHALFWLHSVGFQGNAIQANMDFTDKVYFDKLIETNGCYKISDYICERAKQWLMTIRHDTTLKFGRHTKFEPIPDKGFPMHLFNLISYNQLLSRLNMHQLLTDYLASLKSVNDVKKSGNPNKNTTIWRTLELENLNGDITEATLWDDMASNFDIKAFESLPKPVLIAISSCKVTMFQNHLQLATTSATHYYLNPDIDDVQISLQEYQSKYSANPPLHIQRRPFSDLESEKTRIRYPLKTIIDLNPKTYKSDRFTTEATITAINKITDWFYIACPDCSKKLKRSNHMFECHNHGPITKDPQHMYNIKAFIADDTAEAAVTLFSPVADTLTNIECNKMVIELGYTDPRIIPDPIEKLRGVKKIFQLHFNQRSVPGNVDFIIDKIMEPTTMTKTDNEPLIPNKRKTISEDEEKDTTTKKHLKPNPPEE